ncbi:hypothetical protein F7725_006348, partial [Dissostichus mawsoni]
MSGFRTHHADSCQGLGLISDSCQGLGLIVLTHVRSILSKMIDTMSSGLVSLFRVMSCIACRGRHSNCDS